MDRRDDTTRNVVQTIKGDTHAALDEAKAHVKAAGHELGAEVDPTARDARDGDGRDEGI
jgi:hypothetical protein